MTRMRIRALEMMKLCHKETSKITASNGRGVHSSFHTIFVAGFGNGFGMAGLAFQRNYKICQVWNCVG
jgi:hypothetical protein